MATNKYLIVYHGFDSVVPRSLRAFVKTTIISEFSTFDVELDFLAVSSYGASTTTSGTVKLIMDLRADITGRHVVLCEGVVDSGTSVSFILDHLKSRGAASIKVATLLDKVPCRKIQVPVDFAGWKIGSEFVVGYGMDAAELYRNLPYVGVLQEA